MQKGVYVMKKNEARIYDSDQERFDALLNEGVPFNLSVLTPEMTSGDMGEDGEEFIETTKLDTMVICDASDDQMSGTKEGWIEERVHYVISRLQSKNDKFPAPSSNLFSQVLFMQRNNRYSSLLALLRKLKDQCKEDVRERTNWDKLIQQYTNLSEKAKNDEDDDFESADFNRLVFQPKKILPLEKLRLSVELHDAIRIFFRAYSKRKEMENAGLSWGNRILLAGPPGNGKTALAGALAQHLGLPFFIVNVGELRESHIGGTGKNISTIFQGLKRSEKIRDGKAVIFFDECDSVATSRMYGHGADREDSSSLNVLLTHLDQLSSEIIVIAATNHPDELDSAFKRRFSLCFWLKAPSQSAIDDYVKEYQRTNKIKFTQKELEKVKGLNGKPWSKVVDFCTNIHSSRILGICLHQDFTEWLGREKAPQKILGFTAGR